MKFRTATLSHDDIRSALWRELETNYPPQKGEDDSLHDWPTLFEVYDGFIIAKVHLGDEYQLVKIAYEIDSEDNAKLTGDPQPVEQRYVYKGTTELAASQIIAGQDASQLLKDLIGSNPLFAAIKDSPNTHFVVFDLTSVGKPSQHNGPVKYQLKKDGLASALPTIISKPIHVTSGFDAHFEAGRDPKPIGAFLGAVGIENEDGSVTVRAVGTLWDRDFPGLVEEIKTNKTKLGASYEIVYLAASAERIAPDVLEIGQYEFSGGAILKKKAAAYPETQILVANQDSAEVFDVMDEVDFASLSAYLREATSLLRSKRLTYEERQNLKDSDFALIQTVEDKRTGKKRKIRRFPIHDEAHRKNAWSRVPQEKTDLTDEERARVRDRIMNKAKSAGDDWAKAYVKRDGQWVKKNNTQGGRTMKYPGIPDELEPVVDGLIAHAVRDLEAKRAELQSMVDDMMKDDEEKKKKAAAAEQRVAELEPQVKDLTDKLAASEKSLSETQAALSTVQGEIEEAKLAQRVEQEWQKLVAEHKFTDKQKAEKLPILKKLVAAKEPVNLDEYRTLMSGAQAKTKVPLFASGGDAGQGPTAEELKRQFPSITAKVR